jgi:DNA polymerase-3 subunit delta'
LGPLRIIKIDQIREVKKNVHYKPFEGVKKVCIITEADAMNIEASNALLKVLEEPPAHTVLFLTTSRREKLLPTIISRCQSINIFPLSLKEAEEILIKDFSLAKKEARLLSVLSLGKVNKALEMKEKDFLAKRDRVIEVLISNSDNDLLKLFSDVEDIVTELEESKEHTKEKLKKDLKEYMKEFREELTSHQKKILEERNKAIILSEYKKEVEEFLNIVLLWFRDVLMFKADEEVAFSFIVNIDKEEEIKTFAKKIKYEVLLKNIEIIGKIKRALEGNANLKLAFEVLFLKLGMNT